MTQYSGMLEPNAPRGSSDDSGSSENPTDQEKALCKQLDSLFQKAAKHRKKYDKDWIDNYKMFRGMQWSRKRPSYKHREVINLIFQTIQSQHSVMLDTRPTVGFLPQEPSDLEFSEILNQLFEADWERNDWMEELAAILLDGHIYSVGNGYACHEEDLHGGLGGIKWESTDPLDLYPDPEATNVNKKAKWLFSAKPEDLDTVKMRYAGHKYVKFIKPDMDDLTYMKRYTETLHKRKNTDLDLPSEGETTGVNEQNDSRDKVMVLTWYAKPTDTEEVEQDDIDGTGEKVYITRLKYPEGRKVVKINNYIMEDGELPYDHRLFPFQRYVNYLLSREYFGMSEIDQTRGPQMVFNKLVNFSLDVLTMMGNPIWLVPMEGNVNTRKLTNAPGLIAEYANGAAPQRVEGVQLQPFVLDLIDRMEKWFNDEAGTQDVTRGVNPTGVTANAAIENLLEAAQKRVKQKMRNADGLLRDFGKQWLGLALQFYTAPQVFRLTNKDGSYKYFKFHVEERDVVGENGEPAMTATGKPQKKKFAVIRDYGTTEQGTHQPSEQSREIEINGDFDVRVNTISGLPFTKSENETKVLNLFDRGIIDAAEVLNRFDYPNKEMILQRMSERQAQEAQAKGGQPPAA